MEEFDENSFKFSLLVFTFSSFHASLLFLILSVHQKRTLSAQVKLLLWFLMWEETLSTFPVRAHWVLSISLYH